MNILFINFEYPPLGGGGGVMTADIARELANKNTVYVITTAFENLKKYEFIDGVHVYRVGVIGRTTMPTATLISLMTFAPAAFFKGLEITRKHAFDVINAHFIIPSGVPALMIAQIRKIPLVVTLIGGDIYDPSKEISPHQHEFLRKTVRFIARHAQALTAISHDTKQRAMELHNIKQSIVVIPIGLVPTNAEKLPREALGFTDQDFVCVSIGRLVPRKGYDTLLETFKQLPNAKLIIIGDGPMKRGLESKIAKYEISERVHLAGFVPEKEKQAMLRSADLYVSAAQHEGFGIVFLEAMDAGLPIVAANDGGQKDFLEHGSNALLVAPHDAKGIATAITNLIEHPEIRKNMSDRNMHDVKKYYIQHTASLLEQQLLNAIKSYDEYRN
ncbi:MAG: glycosyltransferase family 4 protein [Candidatus Andersenbacteria bacterium]